MDFEITKTEKVVIENLVTQASWLDERALMTVHESINRPIVVHQRAKMESLHRIFLSLMAARDHSWDVDHSRKAILYGHYNVLKHMLLYGRLDYLYCEKHNNVFCTLNGTKLECSLCALLQAQENMN